MQKYFVDLKGFVEARYPEFQGNISGALYPPPKYAEWIATITGEFQKLSLKAVLILIVLFCCLL